MRPLGSDHCLQAMSGVPLSNESDLRVERVESKIQVDNGQVAHVSRDP